MLEDLAHEFGADRAARTGHEDRLAGDGARQELRVGGHGIAAQQVFDFERAHIGDADAARRDILHCGQDLDRDRVAFQFGQQLAAFAALAFGNSQEAPP